MQLSPLQSRLAASLIASCLLLIIYLLLFSPQFALAADASHIPSDHNADGWTYERHGIEETSETLDLRSPMYEPEFTPFDRSIIGRAPAGVTPLPDNEPQTANISPGTTLTYVYEASSVAGRAAHDWIEASELRRSLDLAEDGSEDGSEDGYDGRDVLADAERVRRQQSAKTLWISANTCQQPPRSSPDQTTMDPPQLTLFVSTSADNTSPGPMQDMNSQKTIVFTEGAVMFNTSLDRDVYLSISAPNVSSEFFDAEQPYNFQVAASTDQSYHTYNVEDDSDLVWVDSDASAALFTSGNLTNSSDQTVSTMPYVMFAQNKDNVEINGLRYSYCGLSKFAQIRGLDDGGFGGVDMGLKKGGEGNLTRQEFYISGLNASSHYIGILVRTSTNNSTTKRLANSPVAGGGGVVFRQTEFETKPNGACTFVFNLTLCDETQYAVPGNPETFPNATALSAFYDNYTRTMYDNFDKVLQQAPCETTPASQYSLARNCNDCKTAYKNWLCSVAIPRCEDFSSPNRSGLQMRNINTPFPNGSFVDAKIRESLGRQKAFSASRNAAIDETVQPGPYKELLPCDDLCYELVRSCPASMEFSCPQPDSEYGYETSYAQRTDNGNLSCNYPGSAHYPSGASALSTSCAGFALLLGLLLVIAL
ncbi:stretch-activated Ca2+-permeable channel component-domain-containing protein [Whalleya microplaca]|nr:stretch-activated Ca2+-permeable channel component-domain-containing protein [Whalleya microplaca]